MTFEIREVICCLFEVFNPPIFGVRSLMFVGDSFEMFEQMPGQSEMFGTCPGHIEMFDRCLGQIEMPGAIAGEDLSAISASSASSASSALFASSASSASRASSASHALSISSIPFSLAFILACCNVLLVSGLLCHLLHSI
jgi:hypothetical protein